MTEQPQATREDWMQAGKIAALVLDYGKSLIKQGVTVLEVCDACDKKIYDLGAIPAFPSQISCDDVAAHFCPEDNDETVFDEQVVSLDVGACYKGAIGDNAVTVDLSGKHGDLIKASRDALNQVLKTAQIGTSLGEIGKTVHETISSHGFAPVKNLSGHGLGVYSIHEKPNVPNYDTGDATELQPGMHLAIEPFATSGKGKIYESSPATIYSMIRKKPVRNPYTRQILKELDKFKGLPFTTRWLTRVFGEMKTNLAINDMLKHGIITSHAPLPDADHGLVSQAEHTIMVEENGIVITTKLD